MTHAVNRKEATSGVVDAAIKRPIVTPLSVFAASRGNFDVIVRTATYPGTVKGAIFDELCLERHGWDFQKSRLKFLGHNTKREPMWRLTRGASA